MKAGLSGILGISYFFHWSKNEPTADWIYSSLQRTPNSAAFIAPYSLIFFTIAYWSPESPQNPSSASTFSLRSSFASSSVSGKGFADLSFWIRLTAVTRHQLSIIQKFYQSMTSFLSTSPAWCALSSPSPSLDLAKSAWNFCSSEAPSNTCT